MPDYKSMYFSLFNKVTDAIEILQQAQIDGEDDFISGSNAPPPIELLEFKKGEEKEPPPD